MDQHILDSCHSMGDKKINEEYYNYMIERIEDISKKDIKSFMNKVSNQKNKKIDVKDTILLCSNYLNSGEITDKEKLIIFYYVYRYHKIVLNNDLVNLKQKKIIRDLKFKKPNSYTGYLDNEEYSVKIILEEDIVLKKIYENYKIMEIYNIPLPKINLQYSLNENKTVIVENNRKITDEDDKIRVFLDIINILRCFNKKEIFVYFDIWNIRYVKERYYLINLLSMKKQKNIRPKDQIMILQKILKIYKDVSFETYQNCFKYVLDKIHIQK